MNTTQNGLVLIVTDGRVVEFAPELYFDDRLAAEEASRWTWFLGEFGQWPVRTEKGESSWSVGIHEVRLIPVQCDSSAAEFWCAISLSGSLVLAGGEQLFQSRNGVLNAIRDPAIDPDEYDSDLDVRLASSMSVHRLKAVIGIGNPPAAVPLSL